MEPQKPVYFLRGCQMLPGMLDLGCRIFHTQLPLSSLYGAYQGYYFACLRRGRQELAYRIWLQAPAYFDAPAASHSEGLSESFHWHFRREAAGSNDFVWKNFKFRLSLASHGQAALALPMARLDL